MGWHFTTGPSGAPFFKFPSIYFPRKMMKGGTKCPVGLIHDTSVIRAPRSAEDIVEILFPLNADNFAGSTLHDCYSSQL